MKLTRFFAGIFAPLILALACANPVDPVSSALTSESARAVIKSLPEVKMTLPASLSVGASAARSAARTAGDNIELTPDRVGSVKSEAWYDLQEGDGFSNFMNAALGILRHRADDLDIVIGQPFAFSLEATDYLELFGETENDMSEEAQTEVTLKIVGDTTDDFLIYVRVDFFMEHSYTDEDGLPQTESMSLDIPARLHISELPSGDVIVELNVAMTIDESTGLEGGNVALFASMNSATGEVLLLQDSDEGWSLMETKRNADGSLTSSSLDAWGEIDYEVAHGDDAAGGIATLHAFESDSDGDGDYEVENSYWGEYYNGNGNLVVRANGSTEFNGIWMDSAYIRANYLNIASYTDNPESVEFIWHKYDGSNKFSFDGITWLNLPSGTIRDFYYSASDPGSGDIPWQPGDAMYYWGSYDSARQASRYYVGVRVPSALRFLGNDYYVSYEYPLGSLLPLRSSDYTLQQEEGTTEVWHWTDWDGVEQIDTWTYYSYYLDLSSSGTTEFDLATDIRLDDKLSQYEIYYWHPEGLEKTKGYFFRSTADISAGQEVSPYFTNPSSDSITRIKPHLTAALEELSTKSLDQFQSHFDFDPLTDPAFSDL